jgi:hypothetical protein
VVVLLAMLVLIRQLLIGHVASGAGSATYTERKVEESEAQSVATGLESVVLIP